MYSHIRDNILSVNVKKKKRKNTFVYLLHEYYVHCGMTHHPGL